MRTNKRKLFLALCSLIAIVFCSLFVFQLSIKPVKAQTYGDFTMLGASVRYPDSDDITGLRFSARIKAENFETLKTTAATEEKDLTAGIVMLRTSLLDDGELTVASDKAIVADLTNKYFVINIDGVDYYEFRCYIYNFPETHYNTFVSARGYITLGETKYYTDTVSRSMTSVAQQAINDGADGLSEYITGQTADYSGKLYVQTDEGYSLYQNKTLSAGVNSAVSALQIAGYSFAENAGNKPVAHVMADGSSEFVGYYNYTAGVSLNNSANYVIGESALADLCNTDSLKDDFDFEWQSGGSAITDAAITTAGSLEVSLKATLKGFNKSLTVYSATLTVKEAAKYTAWQAVDAQYVTAFDNYGIKTGRINVVANAPQREGLSYYKFTGATVAPAVKIQSALTEEQIAKYRNGYMLFEVYLGGSASSGAYFGKYNGGQCLTVATVAAGEWYTVKMPMANVVDDFANFNGTANTHEGKLFCFTSESLANVDIYFSQIVLIKDDTALPVTDETSNIKLVTADTEVNFTDWFETDSTAKWSVDGSFVTDLDPRAYGEGEHTVKVLASLGDLNYLYAAYSAKFDYVTAWQKLTKDNTAMAYQYGSRKTGMFEVVQNTTVGGRTGNFYHLSAAQGAAGELGLKVAPAHSKEVLTKFFANGYVYFDYYIETINGESAPNYSVPSTDDARWSRFGTYNNGGNLAVKYDLAAPVAMWNRMYLPVSFLIENYADYSNLTAVSNFGKLMYFIYTDKGATSYYVSEIGITNNAKVYMASSVRAFNNYSSANAGVMTVTNTAPGETSGTTKSGLFYKFNATMETAFKAYTLRTKDELTALFESKYLEFKFYIDDVGGDNSKSMAISFAYVTSAAVSGNYAYGTWHTVKVPMSAIIDGYDSFQNIGDTGHAGKLFKLEYAEDINAEIYLSELVIVD